MKSARTPPLALLAAMILAVLLAIVGTTPPAPQTESAPTGNFSAARAMSDVRAIAATPHPAGSAADARVQAFIAERLRSMGLTVRLDRFVPDAARYARNASWAKPGEAVPTMSNLVAVLPGRDRSLPALALMAHHDSVGGSPGAADDTAGVAAILETVRAVRVTGQSRRDLMVIVTDGEEPGLFGAERFFGTDPERGRIGALINLEARGGGGRATLFQTTPANGAAIALAARALHHPAGTSLAVFLYKVLPNDTDLTEALAKPPRPDFAAYNFAFIGRPELYHSPRATPERLDQGALQDMGAQTLDLARALLTAPQLPVRHDDVVFFDLFGTRLIVLPAWSGWPLLAVGLGALALLVRRTTALKSVLGKPVLGKPVLGKPFFGGAGRMLALIVATIALATLANGLSLTSAKANYYDRLAAIPRLELIAAAVALSAVLVVFARWKPSAPGIAGAALPLWLMAAALQWFAPTAAYVAVLPVALATLAALLPQGGAGRALAVLIGAMVAGYQIALAHQLLQGVGPVMPGLIALPLALAVLALLPLWRTLPVGVTRGLVAFGVIVALGTALWVRFDALADTVPTYSIAR
ncbi:M28 family peptidase [Novosphingobium sp.]|uniref:M28 family peptidase n=1 Tax=Novosphingobium sp. TaxID=1874826 RepID=UPI0038BC57CB